MQSQTNFSANQLANVCKSCGQHRLGSNHAQELEFPPATGYIRQKLLLSHFVPFSAATLWRKVLTGEFPAPVKLSTRVTGWRVGEIQAWLASPLRQGAVRK